MTPVGRFRADPADRVPGVIHYLDLGHMPLNLTSCHALGEPEDLHLSTDASGGSLAVDSVR